MALLQGPITHCYIPEDMAAYTEPLTSAEPSVTLKVNEVYADNV